MYRSITSIALLAALVFAAVPAANAQKAQGKAESQLVRNGTDALAPPTTNPDPMLSMSGPNMVTITQNASQTINTGADGVGVSCPTPPTSVFRRFDLSNFSLPSGLNVTNVGFGIESVTAGPSTFNLYRLNGDFTRANLTQLGTAQVPLTTADNGTIRNVPITGTFGPTDILVVEWVQPRANLFFGGNSAGQTAPTFLQANGCNTPEPTDLAILAPQFATSHWVVNVTGTTAPTTGPALSITPTNVQFGTVNVGQTETRTVTLTNSGTAPVTISSITSTGAGFSVNQAGTMLTLAPGASTTFTVSFLPTTAGAATGSVTVTSNAPGSPATIALTGTGNADVTTTIPAGTTVGGPIYNRGTGAVATCTPANPGFGDAVAYKAIPFTVNAAGPYTITTAYPVDYDGYIVLYQGSLDPTQPCVNRIAFNDDFATGGLPGVRGSRIANVALMPGNYVLSVTGFANDDAGTFTGTIVGPAAVTFEAAGPALSVTPTTIAFGNVATGGSRTATVTIRNTGGTTINLASVTYSGSPAISASAVGPAALAPGDTRTVTLTFSPTAAGAATGTLTVTSDAPNSPVTVTITGTGVTAGTGPRYTSLDTPIAIPDNNPTGIVSTITVPASAGLFVDVNVDLDITHTYVADLIVRLDHAGASSLLVDQPGRPAIQFGCASDDIDITVDDEGNAGSVEDGCEEDAADVGLQAYVAGGRYTPSTPLAVFDTTPAAGDWVLTVSDNGALDTGTLNSWVLVLNPTDVAGEDGAAATLSRLAVAPNPIKSSAQIDLTVSTTQDVRVALYDALGREVSVLLDRSMTAGQQAYISLTTAGLPSGVYVVRATGTDLSLTQRVTVIR